MCWPFGPKHEKPAREVFVDVLDDSGRFLRGIFPIRTARMFVDYDSTD